MSSTVKSIAYVHTADIDPNVVRSGATWEGLANICVTAAEKALETPPKGYTPTQRNSLTDIFASMKVTHRSIRLLVALGDEKPESVDALVLARLQLEGLYTLCLLAEIAVPQLVAEEGDDAVLRGALGLTDLAVHLSLSTLCGPARGTWLTACRW